MFDFSQVPDVYRRYAVHFRGPGIGSAPGEIRPLVRRAGIVIERSGPVRPTGTGGRPLIREPLYEQAYARIREAILSGELAPGARVDPQTLADQYSISRTPVREAARQLQQEGLLEVDYQRRFYVFTPTAEGFAEVYTARAALESMAVDVLVHTDQPFALDTLWALHADATAALAGDNWREVSALNTRFHLELVRLSRSELSLQLLSGLHARMVCYRNRFMQERQHRETAVEEHGRIIELIAARDESAPEAVHRHLVDAGRIAVETLPFTGATETPSTAYLRKVGIHSGTEETGAAGPSADAVYESRKQ